MVEIHLRPVTLANYRDCLALQVEDAQTGLFAFNAKSLAEAYVNPTLTPLAIYDVAARSHEEPPMPMLGFTMVELAAGVGFIARLMIDRAYQRKRVWPGRDDRSNPPPAAIPRSGDDCDEPPRLP